MYSAFHDFSGKLISGMGLEAPSPPVSFSFADATGSHDTSPTHLPSYRSDSAYPTESNTDAWSTNPWPSSGDYSSGLTPSDNGNVPLWGDANQSNNLLDPNQFGAGGAAEGTAIDPSSLQLDFSAFGGPKYDLNNFSGNDGGIEPLSVTPPQILGFDSPDTP